jgi:protein-tyrosine-phosphatase
MRVLFVCTGNICRSPMAAGLFRFHLERAGCDGIEIASAGTWADAGNPATDPAQAVVAPRGVDLSAHRSRPLTAEELAGADLVVAMTSVHLREVAQMAPEAAGKVLLLKALPEMAAGSRGLDGLLAAPRPPARRALDVDDPIGLPITAYERCAAELEAGVEALAGVLCSPAAGDQDPSVEGAENEPEGEAPE